MEGRPLVGVLRLDAPGSGSTAAVEVFLWRRWSVEWVRRTGPQNWSDEVMNEFRGPGDWRPVTWSGLDGSSQLGPRWCASGSGLFLQDGPHLFF
jgi:hypothetical protein